MIERLRRMLMPPRPSDHLAAHESIKPQLAKVRAEQQIERARTDRLAHLLDDYRRQDHLRGHGR